MIVVNIKNLKSVAKDRARVRVLHHNEIGDFIIVNYLLPRESYKKDLFFHEKISDKEFFDLWNFLKDNMK